MLRKRYLPDHGANVVPDTEMATFFEAGCALVIGVTTEDGAPHGARAWGLSVVQAGCVRLLVNAADDVALRVLRNGGRVAITGADVPTLRSMQAKGRAVAVEPATDADRARARAFRDDFFTDIAETDGTPMALLDRLVPLDYMACTVMIEEVFDQTPGPGAGAPLPDPGAAR